jgi:hypothetical protein
MYLSRCSDHLPTYRERTMFILYVLIRSSYIGDLQFGFRDHQVTHSVLPVCAEINWFVLGTAARLGRKKKRVCYFRQPICPTATIYCWITLIPVGAFSENKNFTELCDCNYTELIGFSLLYCYTCNCSFKFLNRSWIILSSDHPCNSDWY